MKDNSPDPSSGIVYCYPSQVVGGNTIARVSSPDLLRSSFTIIEQTVSPSSLFFFHRALLFQYLRRWRPPMSLGLRNRDKTSPSALWVWAVDTSDRKTSEYMTV